jgi:hypothetical protein
MDKTKCASSQVSAWLQLTLYLKCCLGFFHLKISMVFIGWIFHGHIDTCYTMKNLVHYLATKVSKQLIYNYTITRAWKYQQLITKKIKEL